MTDYIGINFHRQDKPDCLLTSRDYFHQNTNNTVLDHPI